MNKLIFGIFILITVFSWQIAFSESNFLLEANNSVIKNDDFEIIYEPQTYRFIYHFDTQLERYVTVKNLKNSQLVLDFFTEIEGPNGFKIIANPFPQWQPIYLDPGESENIFIRGEWEEIKLDSILKENAEYDYFMKVNVFPIHHQEKKLTLTLNNKVLILSDTAVRFPNSINKISPNFWISGYVFDKNTKQPIPNIRIKGWANNLESVVVTDKNGFYKLPLFAHQRVSNNTFMEINLNTEAPGYQIYYKTITPEKGGDYKLDIYLEKEIPSLINYTLKQKYNTGPLHLHRGDSSKNGDYFALVPFHSVGVSKKDIKDNAYLWFFNKDGELLWKYKLGYHDTTVDVSDDGEYIATAIQSTAPYAILLNKKGELLWKFTPPENKNPTEVQISHNNKYYAVGCGDGSFYLLDRETGKILWNIFLEGQIRNIKFEENDSQIYVSEGHGYLYSLSIDGKILWRTYVYSWTIDMAVSQNFIFTGSKAGKFVTLLNKKTGEVVWRYPVEMVPDRLLIAPDESFFYVAISSAYSRSFFLDKNGKILYAIPLAGNSATFSKDGRFMILATRTEALNKSGSNNDTGVPLIELIDTKNGNVLWSTIMNDDLTRNHPAHFAYSWISDDMEKIIIADFQYVYFFEKESGHLAEESQTLPKGGSENLKGEINKPQPENRNFWQKIIDLVLKIFSKVHWIKIKE